MSASSPAASACSSCLQCHMLVIYVVFNRSLHLCSQQIGFNARHAAATQPSAQAEMHSSSCRVISERHRARLSSIDKCFPDWGQSHASRTRSTATAESVTSMECTLQSRSGVPCLNYPTHRKCAPTAYSRIAASLSSTAARCASGSPRSTCADTCAAHALCNCTALRPVKRVKWTANRACHR